MGDGAHGPAPSLSRRPRPLALAAPAARADVHELKVTPQTVTCHVVHAPKLRTPRAETPTRWIVMGFDDDLAHAARKAVRGGVDWLVAQKGLTREDACQLLSVAGDVAVTEIVDRNKTVQVSIPKAVFAGGR